MTIDDISDEIALLALQGPKAAEILQPLAKIDLSPIKYYCTSPGRRRRACTMIISRTGYTGEDGFELYSRHEVRRADVGRARWAPATSRRAGLGARDTLRLEMGMALYGNDIDDTVTPLEANLAWLVKLNEGRVRRKRRARRAEGARARREKLVGFTMARAQHRAPRLSGVLRWRQPSGVVCSGTMSPTLGIPIGTAYLPAALAPRKAARFEVEIRGKRVTATVVKPPFYKDASHL